MPFPMFSSKFLLIIASLLVHHALVARSAPSKLVPVAVVPTNPASATGGVGNTSSENPLLDATKLPFLASCNADLLAEKLCEQYRALATTVFTLKTPDPVTVEDVQKASQEMVNADNFCDNLTQVLKNRKAKHPEIADNPLDNKNFCTVWCVKMTDNMTLSVNPICKVLLWGFRQELPSAQGTLPKDDLGLQVAGAIVPPLLVQNVKLPEAVKDKELPAEAKPVILVASQPNSADPKKTIQEPPILKSNDAVDTKESPSETVAVKSASNAAVVEQSKATTGKGATTTASNVQQKPTKVAVEEVTADEEGQQLDDTDEQNENNINANNNDEKNGVNAGENTDEVYDDEIQQADPKESSVKEERNQIGDEEKELDDSAEQPAAAAAVQIERVDPFFDQDDSNFFSYFMFMMFASIVCYVAYHNKSKLMALLVEGRRSNSGRGGFSKGRKHTAAYRKLDSNLEEAITSNASASSRSTSQIIY